jgi:hypothetical protein
MRTMTVFACVVAAVCFGKVASAIEGGSTVVDTLGIEATSFDQVGSVAGTLDTEVAVKVPSEDWAILAGVSYRSVDPDWSDTKLEGWGGKLGIKYYFTRMTSLALLGSREEYDAVASRNATAASLAFEQRLLPARSGVSPFVDASLSVRFPDYVLADPVNRRDHDYVIRLGAGCDFMLTDTLALAFGIDYNSIMKNLSDLTKNDGWTGTIGFVGYFD